VPRLTLAPMLPTTATALPEGPLWTYEVKWDGYRALAIKDGRRVQLLSRNQKDLTPDYPSVVKAVSTVRTSTVVLDGEIAAIDEHGRPSFQALQHRGTGGLAIVYYVFDVLRIGHESLLRQPLEARRERLRLAVLGSSVLLSEPLPGSADRIEREIRKLGLEGVVAKRRDSVYQPGERTPDWVKVTFNQHQEFVIGGYSPMATRSIRSSSATTEATICTSPGRSAPDLPHALSGTSSASSPNIPRGTVCS
jgi:bifunctional non-homologous end joining protein LigD